GVAANEGRVGPIERSFERRREDRGRQVPHRTVDRVDVLQEPGSRANGLHEHPHGVRAEDQALRLTIEGEAAVEELRSLLAPVAAPITFGTVGAVAVEAGVDVEGVESGHTALAAPDGPS